MININIASKERTLRFNLTQGEESIMESARKFVMIFENEVLPILSSMFPEEKFFIRTESSLPYEDTCRNLKSIKDRSIFNWWFFFQAEEEGEEDTTPTPKWFHEFDFTPDATIKIVKDGVTNTMYLSGFTKYEGERVARIIQDEINRYNNVEVTYESMISKLFVIFNHKELTPRQIEGFKEQYGQESEITLLSEVDQGLQAETSNISPTASLLEIKALAIRAIRAAMEAGAEFIYCAGELSFCFWVNAYASGLVEYDMSDDIGGMICLTSTTKRTSVDKPDSEGKITTISTFSHERWRKVV